MGESLTDKIIADVVASGYTEILLLDGASESEDAVLVLVRAIAKHVDPLEKHNRFLEDTLTKKAKHMEDTVGSLEARIQELEKELEGVTLLTARILDTALDAHNRLSKALKKDLKPFGIRVEDNNLKVAKEGGDE